MLQTGIDVASAIAEGAIQGLVSKLSEWTGSISDFFLKPIQTFSGQLSEDAFNSWKMIADSAGNGLYTSQITFSEKVSSFMMHCFNWKEASSNRANETWK